MGSWITGLLWAVLFVAGLPALAIVAARVVRKRVDPEILARHNDVAGFIYAVIGVVYAVLLGFTAIIVWEQFRNAQEGVEREASVLADLYRDAQVFAPDIRDQVAAQLRSYARLVVEKEWPAMAEGNSSPEAWNEYNQLWRIYHEFTPPDEHQGAWYAESLQRLNELGDLRRERLLSVHSGVPGIIWAVLLGAGTITIGFTLFFGTRNARTQGLMIACLSVTIGLVLLSISALEHPFAGITRVEPEAFRQFEEILDVWSQHNP